MENVAQPVTTGESAQDATTPPPRQNGGSVSAAEEQEIEDAATTIQRNYRGYRTRRQMDGLGLDPSTRWVEAIKEARYRNLVRPQSRLERITSDDSYVSQTGNENAPQSPVSSARRHWQLVKGVARRAEDDATSDSDSEVDMNEEQRQEHRRKKAELKRKYESQSRMMGLEYWLEMVDEKHRYGSHLRAYHAVWKNSDTHENFFYWLDKGEGRSVEVPTCSRAKLDRDQVRYLSKEERQHYLVHIDENGHLRWAKNKDLVNTTKDYKDSMKGIVPISDTTPAYREETRHPDKGPDKTSAHSSSSSESEDSIKDGQHYVNKELHEAQGIHKVQYVSAAAVLDHLLQSTTKKNTWIFVCDTAYRLYIGIKQSGAFQHSSFLKGARISAAGLIKVKNGQLRRLSPLSGHYRPPTENFRNFVASLKERDVDMSRVSISRSYAVLLGLEGYMRSKQRAKSGVEDFHRGIEKVFNPEEARRKEEAKRDKSKSAARERELEEAKRRRAEEEKREKSMMRRLERWLHKDEAKELSKGRSTTASGAKAAN